MHLAGFELARRNAAATMPLLPRELRDDPETDRQCLFGGRLLGVWLHVLILLSAAVLPWGGSEAKGRTLVEGRHGSKPFHSHGVGGSAGWRAGTHAVAFHHRPTRVPVPLGEAHGARTRTLTFPPYSLHSALICDSLSGPESNGGRGRRGTGARPAPGAGARAAPPSGGALAEAQAAGSLCPAPCAAMAANGPTPGFGLGGVLGHGRAASTTWGGGGLPVSEAGVSQ